MSNLCHYGVKGQKWGIIRQKSQLDSLSMTKTKVKVGNIPAEEYVWHDKNGKKVAELKTWDWWDGKNISDLEIAPAYRGQRYSYQLLDYATKKLGVKNLAVEKTNTIAKHVYDVYGFKETDSDNRYYYMSI